VESSHQIRCLGVLDNRLSCDRQVEKAIVESRKVLEAVKVVREYFSTEETVKLVTAMVFSRLYNASEAWLLPTLKEELFRKLFSQLGKILKIVDKELNYTQLHIKYKRTTPRLFALYQRCINYYNVINDVSYLPDERGKVVMNTMQVRRNKKLIFIRQNAYRCGLNNVSNRLCSVTNMIKQEWMIEGKSAFKINCKKHVI